MRNYTKIYLLLIAIAFVAGTAIAAIRSQEQSDNKSKSQKSKRIVDFEKQFPIADYSAPEPTEPVEREKREAKGKKYDKSELTVDPYSDAVTTSGHWATGLPALPVSQSAVIVIGKVLDAHAYMSPKKMGVYSEFTVVVDEVLKDESNEKLLLGKKIDVTRAGGRVRFPGGKVGLYWVTGQGMPQIERKYLFFLTRNDQDRDFSILTGYELSDGHVFLLDNPGSGHPFTKYNGADETSLLNDVRAGVARLLPPPSN